MNCRDVRSHIVDLARHTAGPEQARATRAHVMACESCRRAFEGEQALSATLDALARANNIYEPAAGLERGVLAAWDRRSQRGRTGSRLPAAAAATLAIAAAAALLIVRPEQGAERLEVPAADAPSVASVETREPSGPQPGAEAASPAAAGVARRPRRASVAEPRASASRSAVRGGEVMTFVPIWPGDPVADGPLQLMRVRLSRASLAGFGLLIDELGTDVNLQADVLVGEDGVARAIRLVPFD
jgi:hypothetical protein